MRDVLDYIARASDEQTLEINRHVRARLREHESTKMATADQLGIRQGETYRIKDICATPHLRGQLARVVRISTKHPHRVAISLKDVFREQIVFATDLAPLPVEL